MDGYSAILAIVAGLPIFDFPEPSVARPITPAQADIAALNQLPEEVYYSGAEAWAVCRRFPNGGSYDQLWEELGPATMYWAHGMVFQARYEFDDMEIVVHGELGGRVTKFAMEGPRAR